jgi:hypothetical protein
VAHTAASSQRKPKRAADQSARLVVGVSGTINPRIMAVIGLVIVAIEQCDANFRYELAGIDFVVANNCN